MNDVFVVKKKKVEVQLPDGSKIEMTRPTIKELNDCDDLVKEGKKSGDFGPSVKAVEDMMTRNGLSKEIMDSQFDAESFAELYVFLSGVKKN